MVGVEAAAVFAASAEKKAKAYTDEKTSALMGGVRWKGYVNYYSDLPATPAEGDAYTVRYMGTSGTDPDRREFVWGKQQGTSTYEWIEFGGGGTIKAKEGTPSNPVPVNADTLDHHPASYFAAKPTIKTVLDATATINTIYSLGSQSSIAAVLPSGASVGDIVEIIWYNGSTPATVSITGTMIPFSYTPSANTRSEVSAMWDGTNWALVRNEQAVS